MTHPAPSRDELSTDTVMQEPPGGGNYGRRKSMAPADEGSWLPLSVEEEQASEFMASGRGFGVVETSRGSGQGTTYGAQDAGMTSHRGVLHPDEYVDPDLLREMVAVELGFTVEEIEGAYKNGRPTPQRASMRAHIDGRLLALSRSGGNMLELARALGWDVQEERGNSGPTCRLLFRALERAKAAEAEVAA